MAWNFRALNSRIRNLMLEELIYDEERETLYLSDRLNPKGHGRYPELLRTAIMLHNEEYLAMELANLMKAQEQRRTRSGKVSMVRVPINANEILAEGEFNRYYIRAVCRLAIEQGKQVIVYRAKSVHNPRPTSEEKIGSIINPEMLLSDLRTHPGVDTALGLPAGPNSGLSVDIA